MEKSTMTRLVVALAAVALVSGCANSGSTERFEYVVSTMAEAFGRKNYETLKSVCHPDLIREEEAALRGFFDKMADRLGDERADWEITKVVELDNSANLNVLLRTSRGETGTVLILAKHAGRWYIRSVP
jgi:hypothetical protein